MNKALKISLITIILIAISLFFATRYIKNSFVAQFNKLHGSVYNLSYSDVTLKSFSFPLKLQYLIKKPALSYALNDYINNKHYDFNVKSEEMILSVNLLDSIIRLNLPQEIKIGNNEKFTVCHGFDHINLYFFHDILTAIRRNDLSSDIRSISYQHNYIRCMEGQNSIMTGDMSFNLSIDHNNTPAKRINLKVNDKYIINNRNISNDIDLFFSTDKVSGYEIQIKEINLNPGIYNINLTGGLVVKGGYIPDFSGKIVLDIKNYKNFIEGMSALYDPKVILSIFNEYANDINENNLSIIVQNIGDEFYIGKQPMKDLLPLLHN